MSLPTDRLQLPDFPFEPAESPVAPSLSTRWFDLGPVPPDWGADFPSAVAPDGSIWQGGSRNLWTYVPAVDLFFPVWSGQVRALAAASATEVWGVFADVSGKGVWSGCLHEQGRLVLPPLPDGGLPLRIWLLAEGVWALSRKSLFRCDAEQPTWREAAPAGGANVVSVGSPKNVWSLTHTSTGGVVRRYDPQAGWVEVNAPKPTNPYFSIVACGDGSVWLMSAQSVHLKRAPEDEWKAVSSKELKGKYLVGLSAASRDGLVVVNGPTPDRKIDVSALAVGIVDQPGASWPAQTPGEAKAYQAISQQLGITAQGGIRDEYNNAAQQDSFSDWRSEIRSMPCPDGVDPDDFKKVASQLDLELHYVQVTYRLFKGLKELNHDFMNLAALMLPSIASMVGLSDTVEDKNRIVHAVLTAMFVQAISIMVGVVTPEGFAAQVAVKLVYAGIKAGIEAATNGPKPPDYRLEIAYAKFVQTMTDIFIQADKTNADNENQILTNWGKLEAVGEQVDSDRWKWPVTATSEIVEKTRPALELFFYQSLMPAKWQIAHLLVEKDLPPLKVIPVYCQYYEPHQDDKGRPTGVVDFWFCNELGAPTTIEDPMKGLFPAEALMNEIGNLEGTLVGDFFKGQKGWSLTKVGP